MCYEMCRSLSSCIYENFVSFSKANLVSSYLFFRSFQTWLRLRLQHISSYALWAFVLHANEAQFALSRVRKSEWEVHYCCFKLVGVRSV